MENKEKSSLHVWGEFLNLRRKVIIWMEKERGYNDSQIAQALSMDEHQVYLIRMHVPDSAQSGAIWRN